MQDLDYHVDLFTLLLINELISLKSARIFRIIPNCYSEPIVRDFNNAENIPSIEFSLTAWSDHK